MAEIPTTTPDQLPTDTASAGDSFITWTGSSLTLTTIASILAYISASITVPASVTAAIDEVELMLDGKAPLGVESLERNLVNAQAAAAKANAAGIR